MQLHWHRRDLRLEDNPALCRDETPVVGLFVFDPALLAGAGPPRVAYLRASVQRLRDAYRAHGSDLVVRHASPVRAVPSVAKAIPATSVSWEVDYSQLATRRDRRMREQLDVPVRTEDGAVCHPPGTITTTAGDPYKVFSYYGDKWLDRDKSEPAPVPSGLGLPGVDPGSIPQYHELDVSECEASLPRAGASAAHERLDEFVDGAIYRYVDRRDTPAAAGTSRLSQDLAFGTIGSRTIWEATVEALADADDDHAAESVTTFRRQLAWREFYTQVLWARPDTVTENYRQFEEPLDWREDPEGLAAWQAGETGFPFVDAGMRQLQEMAWMHNRVRMVVASFLTKDLLLDWREGYRWFRTHLVDHDTANDVGGWQWAASTGTDAQPYFRIFNPTRQGEQHDPDATYIKHWVPELRETPAEVIHSWPERTARERGEYAPAYPAPILDHDRRREAAIDMFEQARGAD